MIPEAAYGVPEDSIGIPASDGEFLPDVRGIAKDWPGILHRASDIPQPACVIVKPSPGIRGFPLCAFAESRCYLAGRFVCSWEHLRKRGVPPLQNRSKPVNYKPGSFRSGQFLAALVSKKISNLAGDLFGRGQRAGCGELRICMEMIGNSEELLLT